MTYANDNVPQRHKIPALMCSMAAGLLIALMAACGGGDSAHQTVQNAACRERLSDQPSFSPDGKTLAVGARIFVESTNKWSSEAQVRRTDNWSSIPTLKLDEGVMDSGVGVAFSPDGTLLGAAEPAGKVHVWRAADWQPVKVFDTDRGLTALVVFSPDG